MLAEIVLPEKLCQESKSVVYNSNPANTGHSPNADLMLAHRYRRLPNMEISLGECPVFLAGKQVECISGKCYHRIS